MTDDTEHIFICMLAIWIFVCLCVKWMFGSFEGSLFVFLFFSLFLGILDLSPWLTLCFVNTFFCVWFVVSLNNIFWWTRVFISNDRSFILWLVLFLGVLFRKYLMAILEIKKNIVSKERKQLKVTQQVIGPEQGLGHVPLTGNPHNVRSHPHPHPSIALTPQLTGINFNMFWMYWAPWKYSCPIVLLQKSET